MSPRYNTRSAVEQSPHYFGAQNGSRECWCNPSHHQVEQLVARLVIHDLPPKCCPKTLQPLLWLHCCPMHFFFRSTAYSTAHVLPLHRPLAAPCISSSPRTYGLPLMLPPCHVDAAPCMLFSLYTYCAAPTPTLCNPDASSMPPSCCPISTQTLPRCYPKMR